MIETALQKAVRERSHILYGPADTYDEAELERIAQRLGVPVSVVSREAMLGGNRLLRAEHVLKQMPDLLKRLSELKESGSIEIDAVLAQMRTVIAFDPKGMRSAASPLPIDL